MEFIDAKLNGITIYRLVLYYLISLFAAAVLLSFAGVLAYDPFALLFSLGWLIAVSWTTNTIFSKAFSVPTNAESVYITALILALILTPIQSPTDLWFLGWAGVLAMASKYIIALNNKHLFNPAAFAVAVTYLVINQSASWWVGSGAMLPFVLLGGVLVVRKLQRADLVFSFLIVSTATVLAFTVLDGKSFPAALQQVVLSSPLFFFAFIILTEPLTTPPARWLRIAYGALVGLLFAPQFHIGPIFTTPELAILIGNVFSYLVSPRRRLVLQLARKMQIAPDVYDFIFTSPYKPAFAPGQYMEWTLGMQDPDSRGNRRYFTLASSPTEKNVRLGIKFYPESSAFKETLLSMPENGEIIAAQLAGDFVLPRDPKRKLVFIAGGIGITPFRSMIQYLLDIQQPRPITVLYASSTAEGFVYVDVLERARRELGIKTIYTVTDASRLPASWRGRVGRITPQMLRNEVPDLYQSTFYISGPRGMVESFRRTLNSLHIHDSHIKTDFFSGLA